MQDSQMKTFLPEVEFRHDQDLPYLEIRLSSYNTASFSKHVHDTFSIGLVERGWSSFFCRKGNHPIGTGEIAVIPAGEVHACNPRTGSECAYKMFYIDVKWMQRAARECLHTGSDLSRFSACIVRDDDMAEQLLRMYGLIEAKATRLEKECCMLTIITSFLLRHAGACEKRDSSFNEPRAVRLAREYIEGNYAENVSLMELSDVAGLSAYHLLRVFRTSVGVPPHTYLIQKRLSGARGMLFKGHSIIEAALENGFADQSHFTNAFKRSMGVTPRQYQMALHRAP